MQGCHLKCRYCHNRDTWDVNSGIEKDVEELLEEIRKYKDYLISSKGGVTVTGGEPLLQTKFILELFKRLKDEGYHTAIDTSRNG